VEKCLRVYGDKFVHKVTLVRTPITALLKTSLTCLSPETAQFGKLYHLQAILELDNHNTEPPTSEIHTKVLVEKISCVNLTDEIVIKRDAEYCTVSKQFVKGDKTVLSMLNNTRKLMGDSAYFKYSAADSNCQDFMLAFAQANGILHDEYSAFIKQDTDVIFDGKDGVRKFANTLTDADARAEELMDTIPIDF